MKGLPRALLFIASLLVGTLLVSFVALYAISQNSHGSWSAALYLTGLIAFFMSYALALFTLCVLVHELGHALGAKCVDFVVYAVRLGPVEWCQLTSGRRFRYTGLKKGYAGAVLVAAETTERLVERYRVLVAAGPLASLLLSIAAFALSRFVGPQPNAEAGVVPFVLQRSPSDVGFLSLLVFLGTMIPMGRKVRSDGLQLWRSFSAKAELRLGIVYNMIAVPWSYGVRGRDWNEEALQIVLAEAHELPMKMVARLFAFYRAMDRGDFPRALPHALEAATLSGEVEFKDPALRQIAFEEAAYALAWIAHDLKAAREMLAKAEPPKPDVYSGYLRTQAAILAAEGNREEALKVASHAEELLFKTTHGRLEASWDCELEMLRSATRNLAPST